MSFSEVSTVQSWLVERLANLGWTHVAGKDLARDVTDVFVESELVAALTRLNPLIAEEQSRVDDIVPLFRAAVLSASSEGLLAANERLTPILRGRMQHKFVGTDDHEPVRFIDFENVENNVFWVSGPLPGSSTPVEDEVSFTPGGKGARFDVVLWVNGIPLVVMETKSPVDAQKSWLDAALDISPYYESRFPTFFATNVLSVATEGRELHYGAVGQPAEDWKMWGSTDDPVGLGGVERLQRSVDLLLTPERILSILQDFTLFEHEHNGLVKKLIPRYPQVEAVEAIHQRILDGGKKGLIWHYQGTGKSLLMAYAAIVLLGDDRVGGPTVVIVLDRKELVQQISHQFETAGLPRLNVAETSEHMRSMLGSNYRGIIVTTINKFKSAGLLNTRENVIVMVDEAHRTQEGTLGADMREALPNARFFGLTGTPISDKDRNTFKLFGDEADDGYVMNHYSMARSLADGVSVPVHVENRRVEFDLDEAALREAEAEFAEEHGLSEQERDFLARKAGHLKTVLVNPERVTEVCEDILNHFESKIAPSGLKAQVVAYDRELVVAYKEKLDELIAERGLDYETVAIMTMESKTDPEEWDEYNLDEPQEAAIKDRFRNPDDPLTFIIVTAKLLTGFDAPILGVQYLDKPLKKHNLFQAITRTNRRYRHPHTGQDKTHGLIVDYIGLGTEIGKALKDSDPEAGGKRPIDIDELAETFEAAMNDTLTRFDGINREDNSFETLQQALETIREPETRDEFAADYIRVTGLWEFLSPHPILDAYTDDYRWLSQVYEAATPTSTSNVLLWHRHGPKTLELVHSNIHNVNVIPTGPEEIVIDVEAIEAMKQLAKQGELDLDPDRDLVANPITVDEAMTLIDKRIQNRLKQKPDSTVYRSLAEQIENLRQQAIGRASDSIEFLKKALELARKFIEIDKLEAQGKTEEAEALLDPHIGALTQIVEQYKPEGTPIIVTDVVRDIDTIVEPVKNTGWTQSHKVTREVKQELRKVLLKYNLPPAGDLFNTAYNYIQENY